MVTLIWTLMHLTSFLIGLRVKMMLTELNKIPKILKVLKDVDVRMILMRPGTRMKDLNHLMKTKLTLLGTPGSQVTALIVVLQKMIVKVKGKKVFIGNHPVTRTVQMTVTVVMLVTVTTTVTIIITMDMVINIRKNTKRINITTTMGQMAVMGTTMVINIAMVIIIMITIIIIMDHMTAMITAMTTNMGTTTDMTTNMGPTTTTTVMNMVINMGTTIIIMGMIITTMVIVMGTVMVTITIIILITCIHQDMIWTILFPMLTTSSPRILTIHTAQFVN